MTDGSQPMSRVTAALLRIGCFGALLCPLGASAADLPSKGDFHITFTGTTLSPMKPISIGDPRTVATNTSIMTAVNQGGDGLLHNMAGRCTGMTTIDGGAKTFEQHGFCDYANSDGDHVFERFDFPIQQQAPVLHAAGEWIGGTGKFAGIGGKFDIQATRLTSLTDGAVQVVGQKVGSYTVEQTSASR